MPYKDKTVAQARAQANYRKNREAKLAYQAAYRKRNREAVRAAHRAWDAKGDNYNRRKAAELVRYQQTRRSRVIDIKYKINEADVWAILIAQNGRCAICDGGAPLCIDHDHNTGAVRGILCRKCNSGIGQLQDRIDVLESAVAYLKNENRRFYIADVGDEVPH